MAIRQNIINLRNARKEEQEESKQEESKQEDTSVRYDPQREIVLAWKAKEYEQTEKSKKWYLKGTIFIGAIVLGAFFLKNWLMGVTFILIAIVGYIFTKKEPRVIELKILKRGVEADGSFYSFGELKSFWIFYGLPQNSYVSLVRKKAYFPLIQLPIGENDPVQIRRKLLKFLPEKEQKEEFSNMIERLIKF